MRSFIAGIRRLVLPWGAITGARLVLDGTTGSIQVFNAANELIVSLDAGGVKALGTAASGSYVLMNNAGAQAQFTLNPDTQGGHTQIPATMEAFFFTPGGLHPALEIDSPTIDGRPASSILMVGEDSLGGNQASIDFTAEVITRNTTRARMLVWGETYPLNAPLVLTGLAQNIAFGASLPSGDVPAAGGIITVTPDSAFSRWEVTLWTDVSIATAGDTTVADLKVDGVTVLGEPIFSTAGATGRATVSQGWQGEFTTSGAHTFQATGKRAAGAGAADTFNAVHTKIRVNLYE